MAEQDFISTGKRCTSCGEFKALSRYSKSSASRDGLAARCKDCHKLQNDNWRAKNPEYIKKWKAENPERKRSLDAKYRERNRDSLRQRSADYYSANTEKIRRYFAERYKRDKLKVDAINKRWADANPEAKRVHAHNRRARVRLSGGVLSKNIAARLFDLQRGKCACCHKPLGDQYELDHIVPIARGGLNEDSNMQLLRMSCNREKSAKDPVDFMRARGFLL